MSRVNSFTTGENGNGLIAGLTVAGYLSGQGSSSSAPSVVQVVRPGVAPLFFDEQTAATYKGRFGITEQLKYSGTSYLILSYNGGLRVRYHDLDVANKGGKLDRIYEPGGAETIATYNGSGQVTEIKRTVGSGSSLQGAKLNFLYTSGRVTRVSYSVIINGQTYESRRSVYSYYSPTNTTHGLDGDLRTAEFQIPDVHSASSGAGWIVANTSYMRYYKTSSSPGFAHGLRYAISGENFKRLMSQGTGGLTNPDSASDSSMREFSDAVFEYDSNRRVTKCIVH